MAPTPATPFPSVIPTPQPSALPTLQPSALPTTWPSVSPTNQPSAPPASWCYTLEMVDWYGDGWNGNMWHWIDESGTDTTGTLSTGYNGTAQLCVYNSSCYTFYVDTNGNWTSEGSWAVTDSAGSIITSGGADNITHYTCQNGMLVVSVCL